MTLLEVIAIHRAAQPTPIAPHDVLTPLGDATMSLYRLKRQMGALTPEERAGLLGLAVEELELLPYPQPAPAEQDARYCFFCGSEYPADLFDCPNHSEIA